VVVLELAGAVAALAGRKDPFAAAAGAEPHRALHVGGDRLGGGRARLLPRLLDEALALRMQGEDEVEAALEDVRGGRAGAGVRERVLRGVELLEEPAGDRDVQAGEPRVERLDLVARGLPRRLAPERERRLHL
jgi:hypothetical protein